MTSKAKAPARRRRLAGIAAICSKRRAKRIINGVLKDAEAGDVEARKLVIPRIWPALKPAAMPSRIAVDPALSPNHQSVAVLEQMNAGALSIEEAALMIDAFTRKALGEAKLDEHNVLRDAVAQLMIASGKPLPPELRVRRLALSEKQPAPVGNGDASQGEASE